MTQPTRTPNPATTSRPERSSKRVAHKKPLAWLPLALLAALALLLALVFLVINAVDDDGPDGPAGDSLGQVGSSDGSGVNGADDNGSAGAGSDVATGTQPSGQPTDTQPGAGQPSAGQPNAGQPNAGAPAGGLAGLAAGALVGGNGIAAATDSTAGTALSAARPAGTAGTVLFAEASAEIDSDGQQVVSQAATNLRAAGARAVTVVGYTDQVAGETVNDPLSQQRADAVAAALRVELPGVTVTTDARGADEPVASNDTEQGRQQNRRAAIVAQS